MLVSAATASSASAPAAPGPGALAPTVPMPATGLTGTEGLNTTRQAPMGWVQQQGRQKRVASPVTCAIGKHFGRAVDARTSISAIIDNAVLCLEKGESDGPNEFELSWFWTAYQALRTRYGDELDTELMHDNPTWDFRNSFCQSIQKGRAQGRTDDIAVLKVQLPRWEPFSTLGSGHSPGWATEEYAAMLKTPDLEYETDNQLREDLNSDIRDASSDQFFAGLYAGYTFPGPGEHPCKGLFASELFINTLKVIFLGPHAVRNASAAAGRRSKAAKNNMTELTVPTIAYCAMLLRFTLHQTPTWYSIDNDVDARFNYFAFYSETIDFLEENALVAFKNDLLTRLNNILFPRGTRNQAALASGGQSSRLRVLQALQAAAPQ